MRINSISLSNGATQTPVFHSDYNPGAFNFSATQASDAASGKYRNLFYLFECPARNVGNRVKAIIHATYDMDGDFSTAAGQSSMTYEVELDGASGGEIRRNNCYRVDITINGLSGHDASLTITPAEWELPVTQTVEREHKPQVEPVSAPAYVGAETFNQSIHYEKNLIVYHTAARDDEQL